MEYIVWTRKKKIEVILVAVCILFVSTLYVAIENSDFRTDLCIAKGYEQIYLIHKVEASEKSKEQLTLHARGAALMDEETGRILYDKEVDQEFANASTTKIMTCILALEQCLPDERVVISLNAQKQPKVKMNVIVGEEYRLKDLLYALMLESYNDVAVAIAEHVGGSVEGFSQKMNKKAKELGCNHTRFVTPNGLDAENHYTTCRDLGKIARYALKNKMFRKIIGTSQYQFLKIGGGRRIEINNKDAFLQQYEGAIGIKTGYTSKAGYCFVGAAQRQDKTLISVVLGAGWPPNKEYKWADTKALLNYGFENYHRKRIFKKERVKIQYFNEQIDNISFWVKEHEVLFENSEGQELLAIVEKNKKTPKVDVVYMIDDEVVKTEHPKVEYEEKDPRYFEDLGKVVYKLLAGKNCYGL